MPRTMASAASGRVGILDHELVAEPVSDPLQGGDCLTLVIGVDGLTHEPGPRQRIAIPMDIGGAHARHEVGRGKFQARLRPVTMWESASRSKRIFPSFFPSFSFVKSTSRREIIGVLPLAALRCQTSGRLQSNGSRTAQSQRARRRIPVRQRLCRRYRKRVSIRGTTSIVGPMPAAPSRSWDQPSERRTSVR